LKKGDQGGFYGDSFDFLGFEIHFFKRLKCYGIFNFYIGGSVNEAAALGLVLIILGALCLWTISKLAGTRMGGVFG